MRTMAYQIYVTDCLYYQPQNKMLETRFYDILKPKKQDTRTGDDIAADIINKLNLKQKGSDI